MTVASSSTVNRRKPPMERGTGADDDPWHSCEEVLERRCVALGRDGWQIGERIEEIASGKSFPRVVVRLSTEDDLLRHRLGGRGLRGKLLLKEWRDEERRVERPPVDE